MGRPVVEQGYPLLHGQLESTSHRDMFSLSGLDKDLFNNLSQPGEIMLEARDQETMMRLYTNLLQPIPGSGEVSDGLHVDIPMDGVFNEWLKPEMFSGDMTQSDAAGPSSQSSSELIVNPAPQAPPSPRPSSSMSRSSPPRFFSPYADLTGPSMRQSCAAAVPSGAFTPPAGAMLASTRRVAATWTRQ